MKKSSIFNLQLSIEIVLSTLFLCTFVGCNNGDEPEPKAQVQTYHVTIKAGKGDANQQNGPRRALDLSGNTLTASWGEGEQVTVRNLTKGTDLVGVLEPQNVGTNETFLSGGLTGTINAGDELELRFLSGDYENQDGTLEYIAAHCDYALDTLHVTSVNWEEMTFQEDRAVFVNQQAIFKITMKDQEDHALNASQLVVKVGDATSYTINLDPAKNVVFVALPGFNNETITLTATVGSDTYTSTSSNPQTFEDGAFYLLTIGMTKEEIVHGFSISPTQQIEFAHGNLQYNHSATSTPKWRIAEHQYDYVGDNKAYLTFGGTNDPDNKHSVGNVYFNSVKCSNETDDLKMNQESWIDLLSWSCKDNPDPTDMSGIRTDFVGGGFKDWGEYEIYDPLSGVTYPANTWRTLSIAEWQYIFCYRPNYDKLFTTASIDGLPYGNVKGIIILPDDFDMPSGLSFTPAKDIFSHTDGTNYFSYTDNPPYNYDNYPDYNEQLQDPADENDSRFMYNKNRYTLEQWAQLEEAGAVFLPAAGRRMRFSKEFYGLDWEEFDAVMFSSIQINYWSSTPLNDDAYYLGAHIDNANSHTIVSDKSALPYYGLSVRLVRDIPQP